MTPPHASAATVRTMGLPTAKSGGPYLRKQAPAAS
jgi:hypothetical protein